MNFRYKWRYSDVKPINWARCSRNKCMRSDIDLCPLQHGSYPTEWRVTGVFSIILHKYKCFAASHSEKWREDTKVRIKTVFLKKNVHKPNWQDYFLYVFRTINIDDNINWSPIRLSLVLLRTLVLWLQIPSQPHILQNSISVSHTFIPRCFMWRKLSCSLCAMCIQHTWHWKERHENLISINLRLQNFPSASHSMLQVVCCFVCPMVHKITPHDRVLSQINPFHVLRTHIF